MSKVVIPASAEELEEMLNDGNRMKDVLGDPESFADFTRSYARAAMEAHNADLSKQLKEGLQMGLAEWVKDNREEGGILAESKVPASLRVKLGASERRRSSAEKALWNRHAPGVRADGLFAEPTELLQAIAPANRVKLGAERGRELAGKLGKLTEVMNSFGSEVPADGGYLIPEHLRSELLSVALEMAVVRPRATVIPMDSLRVPIPTLDDTSHASSVFGGIQAYWTEEAAALTESQASFAKVVLDAKKLTAYATVPNELLQDAPAFAGFFDAKFPQAIAYFEDVAFFSGTGAGEPLGFINCPASVSTTAETGQATGTILWENITKMYARMLPTSLGNAVWIANIETFPQLATMALSVGTGGSAVWLGNVQNPGSAGPPVSILGRPVYFTEKCPALSTTGDINFVDLSYYLIGDRMSMQASTSEHYLFANDRVAYRIIERLDGRPWLASAITPRLGSSTLTPFVQLATR